MSTNISDPCLLLCLPSDVPSNSATERSNNNSELNSIDSGIQTDHANNSNANVVNEAPDDHFQKVFVERKTDFSDLKKDQRSRGNSLGHFVGRQNTIQQDVDASNTQLLNSKLDKTCEELNSLKVSHGKLQKVLSEKASELSNAVRKAEAYEREAKKLRYKLDEIRRQQRHDRQQEMKHSSRSSPFCDKTSSLARASRDKIPSVTKMNESDSTKSATNGSKSQITRDEQQDDEEDQYEEINAAQIDEGHHQHVEKNSVKAEENCDSNQETTSKNETQGCDDEVYKNGCESSEVNNDGNQAIYATVNLEMKKSCKKQKNCTNGNILCDKENIVALI